jgi:probable HAF family extracellular repeat protein
LRPFRGDTVAFAFGINDRGQAVGTSGPCSNVSVPLAGVHGTHAVLWERDGSAIDLGNLDGTKSNNIAGSINDRGEISGTSQIADGSVHTFVWTREAGMRDIGTLAGAVVTVAPCCNTLNNRGEVVGFSIDAVTGNVVAFLWSGRALMDLNT